MNYLPKEVRPGVLSRGRAVSEHIPRKFRTHLPRPSEQTIQSTVDKLFAVRRCIAFNMAFPALVPPQHFFKFRLVRRYQVLYSSRVI